MGSIRVLTLMSNRNKEALLVVIMVLAVHFSWKGGSLSHEIKRSGENMRQACWPAGLGTGRRMCSMYCSWTGRRWAVPQQLDSREEEYHLLPTPHTGWWEEGAPLTVCMPETVSAFFPFFFLNWLLWGSIRINYLISKSSSINWD